MPGTEDSGQDPIVARVAVSLPLWSGKSRARRQVAAGRQETAAAQRRRLELELTEDWSAPCSVCGTPNAS